jgi:hypothetical protein
MNKKIIICISLLLSFSIALFILLPVHLNIQRTGQLSLDVCKKNVQFDHLSGAVYIPIISSVVLNISQYRIVKLKSYLSFIFPPLIEINKPPA